MKNNINYVDSRTPEERANEPETTVTTSNMTPDNEVVDTSHTKDEHSDVEGIVEELDNLANIYGWHKDKCAGHSHHPACPVVKLRRMITSLH